MKKIKTIFCHMGQFILSNLITMGIYTVLLLSVALFADSIIETLSKHNDIVNPILYSGMAIVWIVPFYIYHFKKEMDTAEMLHKLMDGYSASDMFRTKMLSFFKYDTIWLAVSVIIVAFIPQSSPITFLFSSAGIFVSIGNQIVGAFLWGIFVVAAYTGCCFVFCKNMKKKADIIKNKYTKSI